MLGLWLKWLKGVLCAYGSVLLLGALGAFFLGIMIFGIVFLGGAPGRRAERERAVTANCEQSGGKMMITYGGFTYRQESIVCVPTGVSIIKGER